MTVIDVALEVIDDNPYNPRKHYPQAKVKEMAQSLREVGLRQIPEGRPVNGRVQLAYGHMRKRGYFNNQKQGPGYWKTMPVDVKEISDQDMFHFSMEENLRRTDITPIEVARCIAAFSEMFPDVTEKDLGEKHGMSEANVSNMKRVLRLPEKLLEKIDQGVISFTQGRELLIFERFENAENLMRSALDGLKSGSKVYGEPNTVDGLQKCIHSVIFGHCRPLDKEWQGYRWDLLFDTRAAGCLECDKMVRTHPTKSATAHYCTDEECWGRHQEEHRETAAAAAKAKMEAEVLERASRDIAPRTPEPAAAYKMEKRGTSWMATDDQGRIIAINYDKKVAEEIAKASFEPVATKVNPDTDEYRLNHTYRFMEKPGSRKLENFDVTAKDLATAAKALGVDTKNLESVKIWKSSGKLGTAGSVSAGWGKSTESLDDVDEGDFSQEKVPGQVPAADVTDRQMEEAREKANRERPVGEAPCDTCLKGETCERAFFYAADDSSGRLVCDVWECDHVSWAKKDISRRIAEAPAPPQEVPEDILALAREKAGTRAEVLDLNDICSGGGYYREPKQGYADLSNELPHIDDPAECLERCTHGFHFAFDSKAKQQVELHICSDTKCLAKKKAAFTRAKNAEGQGRKKAETQAVKLAITKTFSIGKPEIKLILLAQMDGQHCSRYYYESAKKPETWLWEKISAGTPAIERTREDLFKRIDKLTDEALASLVVEFMFYSLTDKGDIGTYEIKAELPLSWLGVKIELPQQTTVVEEGASNG